ncbi:MAG: hypothetical protein BWY87_01031 [Deltaproteobacteria bacterium ADurb.Bin510]|nr:MAG: hypothetical protein BWY87_01031 [Deltaproteobacteria bacterium ADurb.Bin510]
MTRSEILEILAPCGLNCRKCLSCSQGEIKRLAVELQAALGNFDGYAERFSRIKPAFAGYPQFKELLAHLTTGACAGCRRAAACYPGCGVAPCCRAKGVDFCGECPDFPCDHSNLDENLKRRWLEMSARIREIGAEAYYAETKELPRYR